MSDSFNVFDLFDFEQSKFSVAVLAALGGGSAVVSVGPLGRTETTQQLLEHFVRTFLFPGG